jgi:hypothetical protein
MPTTEAERHASFYNGLSDFARRDLFLCLS